MQKGPMFKAVRVFAVLALASVILILLITLRPKAQRQVKVERGFLVETLRAEPEDVHMTIETYGTVKPRETLKLVAEVRGRVVEVHPSFKEGEFFRRQTVLMKIDPRTYQLEVERRQAQIDQIEAEFKRLQKEVQNLGASIEIAASDAELALKEFERLKELMRRDVVAETTLEKAEQGYLARLDRLQGLRNQLALTGPAKQQLEARLNLAEVTLRQAKLDLERAGIDAPFDGWVLAKAVEAGQHVSAGQHLGEIYADGALDVEARVPVKDVKWLAAGPGSADMPEAEIVFGEAQSVRTWKGRVARTKASMDEKTRTLPMVVEVDPAPTGAGNPGGLHLRPGMFVKVFIKGKQITRAFVLPRHMVQDDDTVYIFQNDRLKIRPVGVLRRFKDKVFVDRGLEEGDLLVRTPISGAVEGMQLRTR